MKPIVSIKFFLFLLPVILTSCMGSMDRMADTSDSLNKKTDKIISEMETDREYLRNMSEAMTAMSKSLQEFETLAMLLTKFITAQSQNPTTPGTTPDIGSILGGDSTPTPTPTPTPAEKTL